MAGLGSGVLTLSDHAKRTDESGKTLKIVEMLSQINDINDDVVWKEGNLTTGERYSVRTSLPDVYWRSLNAGTSPSKSSVAQVTEACGILDAWSEVDVDLANLGGDPMGFRLTEAQAFLQSMSQEYARALFYENQATNPERFTGLSPRYALTTGATGENIVLGGGSGADNSSMWLVVWGPSSVYGFYPKGSMAGLEHKNYGEETVETTAGVAGTRMRAYRDQFIWKCGLAVKDWRYVVRIPNIDISDLIANGTAAAALRTLLAKAVHRVPSLSAGRAAIYCNRTCFEMFDIQALSNVSSGGGITYQNVDGKVMTMFRGIPVRKVDQLTQSETLIS